MGLDQPGFIHGFRALLAGQEPFPASTAQKAPATLAPPIGGRQRVLRIVLDANSRNDDGESLLHRALAGVGAAVGLPDQS